MNIYTEFREQLIQTLNKMISDGLIPSNADFSRIAILNPPTKLHDLATNAAFIISSITKQNSLELAQNIEKHLKELNTIESIQITGKGHINIKLTNEVLFNELTNIINDGMKYGDSTIGCGHYVNVEYVSANPTGPLHAAHARGAVVGDVLANLLKKTGHYVVKEYYINDAGSQIDTLTKSTFLRHKEACGETIEVPEGMYPGEYLKDIGKYILNNFGDLRNEPEEMWYPLIRDITIQKIMEGIKQDLNDLGVTMNKYTSEREVVESFYLDTLLEEFKKKDLIYEGVLAEPPKGKIDPDWEPVSMLLFRSTRFGDDLDRPLKKSDGSWTYFANDIAYHFKKIIDSSVCSLWDSRNLKLINIWGADHGGYVKRMQAAVSAILDGKIELTVKLCQLVNLMSNSTKMVMSKRSGNFVSLREVIDAVGRDVVRFIMLTRKNDQALDFDFAKVVEKSKENPTFYVQYAHARTCSVFKNAEKMFPDYNITGANVSLLSTPAELALIKSMAEYPRIIESAANTQEPHRIAFYLYDLASEFHSFWINAEKFLIEDNKELTMARLTLVKAVQNVIASGLNVMGIVPVEEM